MRGEEMDEVLGDAEALGRNMSRAAMLARLQGESLGCCA